MKNQKAYIKPAKVKDLREQGRIILAHGEVTGHCHEVLETEHADTIDSAIPAAQYFEEPGTGRRILLVVRPCVLRHDEHALVSLDPAKPVQARQGDVFLNPIGGGAWEVIRQREYHPEEIRQVAD
jgi:hypothetical protein